MHVLLAHCSAELHAVVGPCCSIALMPAPMYCCTASLTPHPPQGVGPYEVRVLVAYCFMMDVERDGLVRPDELLLTLHALPLRTPAGVVHKPGFGLHPARRGSPLLDSLGSAGGAKRQLAWAAQGQVQVGGSSPLGRSSSNASAMLGVGLPPGSVGWGGAVGSGSTSAVLDPVTGQYVDPVTGQYMLPPAATGGAGQYMSGAVGQYATPYPYAAPAPLAVSPPAAQHPPHSPPSPSSSQPYMIPGAPGQPPMVGYIIPYQQDLFQQLVQEAARPVTEVGGGGAGGGSSRGASPSRGRGPTVATAFPHVTNQDQDQVEVMDEFAFEERPGQAVQAGGTGGGPWAVQVRPGSAGGGQQYYGGTTAAAAGQYGGGPFGYRSVSSPGYIQYGQGGQYGQQQGQYSQQQQVEGLAGALGVLGLQDGSTGSTVLPTLQQWRDQQGREVSQLGFSPSSQMGQYGRGGSTGGGTTVPPAMWRTNTAQLPPGSMSVMADGRGGGRVTPFGLMQV